VKRAALLGLALAIANAASAQEMAAPRIEVATIDWSRAEADAGGLPALNAAVQQRFPGIARSAVPVLLPFDVERFRKAEQPADPDTFMLGDFKPTQFFQTGPAGFDAVFSLRLSDVPDLSEIPYAEPVYVLFSGFRFTYALGGPPLPDTQPVKDLDAAFPGVRRTWQEFVQRTIFERYGAIYVVSIFCRDISGRRKVLSCPQATRVADRFVKSLRLAGGAPDPEPIVSATLQRPERVDPAFTYLPPGALIPRTGRKPDLDGRADRTVYADLRFPLRDAPAFANSQSFNNWGDCDFTGRSPGRVTSKDAPYACKINGRPLVFNEAAGPNFQYPWRDNFCEHRRFPVGQCPGGEGHQGQDIRPSFCKKFNEGADRCIAYQQDAVAAGDGMILRPRRQEALLLFINSRTAHVRLRYLHMRPSLLDERGMMSGRRVQQGDVLGQIGNYDEYEHGTTYHLHFDMQVPTPIGYVFVNPYMTLVASYEHLLDARGTEVMPADPAPPAAEESSLVVASIVPLPRARETPPLPRAREAPPPVRKAKLKHAHRHRLARR
jgi:hypothetical protein